MRMGRVVKTYWFPESTLYNQKDMLATISIAPSNFQYLHPLKPTAMHDLRGNGGRICFRAEAWKATACETPTFWRRRGDRVVARVCRSSDGRANEAIVTRDEDETKRKQFDSYRMKLEPRESASVCQPSSGSGDWLMGFRPAEIGRCEERLARDHSTFYLLCYVVQYFEHALVFTDELCVVTSSLKLLFWNGSSHFQDVITEASENTWIPDRDHIISFGNLSLLSQDSNA